jgi:hypothetical protein
MLPISSNLRKATRGRRGARRQVKLPTNMQSKNWPKCPICGAPYKQRCINCGYIMMQGLPVDRDNLKPQFKRAKDIDS